MRYFSILPVLLMMLVSCGKGRPFASVAAPSNIADTSATVKYIGYFANGDYGTAIGWAKVVLKAGKYTLLLEDLQVSDGPDLHIYISREATPVNFIDLGVLKGTTGTASYEIAVAPDFTKYKYAVIISQQLNRVYGYTLIL